MIRIARLFSLPIVLFVLFCSAPGASAGVLQGTVVEVIDGETFTVSSDNRVVKIRLLALAAPKDGHSLSRVAREHLAALVQGKTVTVKYMWVDQKVGAVAGLVFLEGVDIGLQMIRDGAAWYNKSYEATLDAQARGLYAESELAARNEKRGVWDESISRPAEIVTQTEPVKATMKAKPVVQPAASKWPGERSKERERAYSAARRQSYGSEGVGELKGWARIEPEGEEFAIRMPNWPTITTKKINVGKGKQITERTYISMGPASSRGRDEIRYIVSSVSLPVAPSQNGEVVIKREEFDKLMFKLQDSFEKSLQSIRPNIVLRDPREVMSGLHIGREYAIELDYGSPMGRVRFFATSRHIYLIGYVQFSYNGIAFLDSFELKDDNKLIIR